MPVQTTKVRVLWPYDTAVKPIPPGWTRDAAADGRFLQGSDSTFTGAADGGGPHKHTDETMPGGHLHIGDRHRHPFSAASTTAVALNAHISMVEPVAVSQARHGHVYESSNWATITYGTDPAVIDNADMKPPWVQAIIIKPDDIGQDIPDGAVCFGDSAVLPTGFVKTDGTGETLDLDGKFVIGATPAGAGGGIGGSATHQHTSQIHNHKPDDHVHTSRICGNSTATTVIQEGVVSPPTSATGAHHNVALDTKVLPDVSPEQVVVQSASSEPAYVKLLGIQNTSGTGTTPAGVIVPFVGAISDMPSEWVLCDGENDTLDCTDRQIKITTNTGEIGDIGGSDTHTHQADPHHHTHGIHNHTTSVLSSGNVAALSGAPTAAVLNRILSHNHAWTVDNEIPTMQDVTIRFSTDDGRFDYRTVVWVKYVPAAPAPPIVRTEPPSLFVPGWNDELRPDTFEPAEEGPWDAPATRGWSADKCGVTTWGAMMMATGWDRPCTLHPVRAMQATPEHANAERCRHHLGEYMVNSRGWTVPLYCCQPSGDLRIGRGRFYVANVNDPHCKPGFTCGVASMPLPDTFLGFFHSNSWGCGDEA